MKKIIAPCGINCAECDAYIATSTNDAELKKEIVKKCYEQFNTEVNIDELECLGCMTESEIKIGYVEKCKIRRCAIDRNIEYCVDCKDYICNTLGKFIEADPARKRNLEELRNNE